MPEMMKCAALTGLSHDDVVGNSGSVFVPGGALVHALVLFGLHPADVHHKGPRVGLHGHVGVILNVEVSPVSCPGEAEGQKAERCYNSGADIYRLLILRLCL